MHEEFLPYALAFREPVPMGAGWWKARRGAWLRLEAEDGLVGLGEIAPLEPVDTPEALAAALDREPYRAAAFELARMDLEGQREGRGIAGLLCESPREAVAVNALCLSNDIEAVAAEGARAAQAGFRTVKVKVGSANAPRDIARVEAVRDAIGDGIGIRLDANGAWDEATALQVLRALAPLGLEYVEDPVKGDAGAIHAKTGVSVAADPRTMEEGWLALRSRSADFLVLKPMALGGLRVTRELACAAIDAGLGVVITSVFDTAVGVAGALHLAASLPGPARAHGLATVGLLEEAPVEGLDPPHGGELRVPARPGLGVRLRQRTP
ncbi:MAG: mandelate racemase/muconate lactonizing enzyme family protein [Burkholderiales bacterium]